MHKIERQSQLLQCLPRNHVPVALHTLAESLGCSARTVRRYIDELVALHHAPWFIHEGCVFLDNSRKHQIEVDGYWFTSEELFSLLALYQMTDTLSEGLLAGHFQEFKQRIIKILGPEEHSLNLTRNVKILPIASPPVRSDLLNKITDAIARQQRLEIRFWNRHSNTLTDREISPYQLVRYRDRWFVDAWCHLRDGLRSFSLEAIQAISSLKQPIKPPQEEELSAFYQSSYGIFTGQSNKTAVLMFSAYQARWIKDQQWHPQQISTWLEDGRYQLQLPYKEDAELIQDILKFGPEVEVIAPEELRQKVAHRLRQTFAQYENDSA